MRRNVSSMMVKQTMHMDRWSIIDIGYQYGFIGCMVLFGSMSEIWDIIVRFGVVDMATSRKLFSCNCLIINSLCCLFFRLRGEDFVHIRVCLRKRFERKENNNQNDVVWNKHSWAFYNTTICCHNITRRV